MSEEPKVMAGEDWNREMARLQTHFGRSMDTKQSESWYHYLKTHSTHALSRAVDELNLTRRVFPSFAELIAMVERFEPPRPIGEHLRRTLAMEIHPNQLPLARFCFQLLECYTRESIQAALNTACESRQDLSEIYVKMSKARFETLPGTAPSLPQLTEGKAA